MAQFQLAGKARTALANAAETICQVMPIGFFMGDRVGESIFGSYRYDPIEESPARTAVEAGKDDSREK